MNEQYRGSPEMFHGDKYEPKKKGLKRTPLRRVSKKQAGLNRKYTVLRREYLEIHPQCEFMACPYRASQIHHKEKRGKQFLEMTTWMGLCSRHHEWIHNNPRNARALGYLK